MDPQKIKVIRGWPPPTTVHEVPQFIGLCGFYQQFVEGFQAVAAPLTAMFNADFQWEWTAIYQASLEESFIVISPLCLCLSCCLLLV